MIKRALRGAGIAMLIVLGVVAAGFAYFSYTRFFKYQRAVNRIYVGIPREEREWSPASRRVFTTLEPESALTYFASTRLMLEVAPESVGMPEWHLRSALWVLLLPCKYSFNDRALFYAHYLPSEGGY